MTALFWFAGSMFTFAYLSDDAETDLTWREVPVFVLFLLFLAAAWPLLLGKALRKRNQQ